MLRKVDTNHGFAPISFIQPLSILYDAVPLTTTCMVIINGITAYVPLNDTEVISHSHHRP